MPRVAFWSCTTAIICSLLVIFSKPLTPFFIAFVIAYMLQPLINKICDKYNISNNLVAFVVFIISLSIFTVIIIVLVPIIYQQGLVLINKFPIYKDYIHNEFIPQLNDTVHSVDPDITDRIKNSLQGFINNTFSVIANLFNNIWNYMLATLNTFATILLVPVILLYLLRDWNKMTRSFNSLLPIKERSKIREILTSINDLLSAYIRGQFNVCIILSTYYSIGLSLIGVDLGLLIGILSGFLIIVPFIGTFIAFCLAMIVCYFSFGSTAKLSYIVILYVVGYLTENYYLTPKIIGDRIGIHPLWIMFSVFALGSVLGFTGIFFAVPIAGIIKVLIEYGIEYYKSSKVYRG